jgi:4-amino-4-deoxy-L-arabinose transferase-like glycosyltransferase
MYFEASRKLLIGLAVIALAGILVTMPRWPTFWPDADLYASIARSYEVLGDGVPSTMRHSPHATDHIVFYGPVFFGLGAEAFHAFGVSKASFRLVSLGGALLLIAGGALLGFALTGSSKRAWITAALLALTPELFVHARSGSMDLLAVGFEVLALAVFLRGLAGSHSWPHGAAAGGLLAAAMLTTPRTYPFIAAFFVSGLVLLWRATAWRNRVAPQLSGAAMVLAGAGAVWASHIPGGAATWARYMAFVATHEWSDVAILPAAERAWSFAVSSIVTPAFAATGALAAAWRLRKRTVCERPEMPVIAFAILAGWLTFVATICVMNLTLTVGTYFALPLFAVVVSLPRWSFSMHASKSIRLALAVGVLVACDVTIAAIRDTRIAAAWDARDSVPVVEFLKSHVPAGSDVIGPAGRYFFTVEEAGGVYYTARDTSWADWARWVPVFNPGAVGPLPRRRPAVDRFLIWDDADEPRPSTYVCAQALAKYTPPDGNSLASLGWIADSTDRGYGPFTLYQLAPTCPSGYDPTGIHLPSGKALR